jgi:hypothetical protein
LRAASSSGLSEAACRLDIEDDSDLSFTDFAEQRNLRAVGA